MNKNFLDKVIEQIVSETRIDYNELSPTLYTPFPYPPLILSFSTFPPLLLFPKFTNHCRDVYGLNNDEVDYVWDEYKKIIYDKIKSNG